MCVCCNKYVCVCNKCICVCNKNVCIIISMCVCIIKSYNLQTDDEEGSDIIQSTKSEMEVSFPSTIKHLSSSELYFCQP